MLAWYDCIKVLPFSLSLLLTAGLVCKVTCYGAITTAGAVSAPMILPALGFTKAGVAAGSLAAWMMSAMGTVKAGSLVALLQSWGATGVTFANPLYAANAVCSEICDWWWWHSLQYVSRIGFNWTHLIEMWILIINETVRKFGLFTRTSI